MGITVLTSITNNYDKLSDDNVVGDAEWVAFLDEATEKNFVHSKIWDERRVRGICMEMKQNFGLRLVDMRKEGMNFIFNLTTD